ncbi:MAG: SDR family oxidoreductase [Armatimonadetes bacterium]|nr:SDR family oxidoreductase [Armatimonadota bacterium]
MEFGIAGKIAMVAASSKGIGLAVAKELAAEGCRVSLCARGRDRLDSALNGVPGSIGTVCDVSSADDLERWHEETVAQLGPVEILVSNSGGPPAGEWTSLTDDQWREGIDSTLMSVVRMTRLVTPAMMAGGWGRIVHISSIVAKEPLAILPISSTLRAGLSALTRLQAAELGQHGITANCVLPGHTLTDRQRHLAQIRAEQSGSTEEEMLRQQAEAIPVKRLADPSEIGAAVAFLCSERAAYISGVNLLVDGGLVRGPG